MMASLRLFSANEPRRAAIIPAPPGAVRRAESVTRAERGAPLRLWPLARGRPSAPHPRWLGGRAPPRGRRSHPPAPRRPMRRSCRTMRATASLPPAPPAPTDRFTLAGEYSMHGAAPACAATSRATPRACPRMSALRALRKVKTPFHRDGIRPVGRAQWRAGRRFRRADRSSAPWGLS